MRRKKTTVKIIMCVAMLFMAVGYALLSTKLNINGSTAVTSSWRVEFTDIRTSNYKGGAYNIGNPTFTSTTASFKVNLVQPGDEITYEIDITNFGDIIAEVKGATYSIDGSEAIYVDIDGVRKGTQIASCEGLSTCPKVTMTIKVGYDPLVEKDPTKKTKTIDITLDIGQYVSSNPTPDGELVPELVQQNDTLVQQILRNNNAQSDGTIDFSKPSYYVSSYEEKHAESTASVSMSSSSVYYYGSGYTFNKATGQYTLTGTTTGKWSTMSTNYKNYPYTCKYTNTNPCTTLYKMTGYTSTTAGVGYKYTRTEVYSENGKGLYYTSTNTEDNKATYYFRGNVTNNYVSFGTYKEASGNSSAGDPIIWRIVRINEDGSIRLVKQDNVGSFTYNGNHRDNAFVGYMYGTAGSTTYALTHANNTNSAVKGTLDTWYAIHLSSYSSYFAKDAGFCNDRSVATTANTWAYGDTALGYGTNHTYYGPFNRTYNNNSPQFACPNEGDDLFTLTTSSKGNKKLTNPIGLLTLDEVVYAGGKSEKTNSNYYLVNGDSWWTMSPVFFGDADGDFAYVGAVNDAGNVSSYMAANVYGPDGVRPVINLKADIEFELTGTGEPGSSTNPYVIKTN